MCNNILKVNLSIQLRNRNQKLELFDKNEQNAIYRLVSINHLKKTEYFWGFGLFVGQNKTRENEDRAQAVFWHFKDYIKLRTKISR